MGQSRGINHRRNSVDLFIMAIRHDVVKNCVEEDINASFSTRELRNTGYYQRQGLQKKSSEIPSNKTTKRRIGDKLRHFHAHHSTTRENSHPYFFHSGLKNVVWWAFVSTFFALIFGQLSTVASATNDLLSKGGADGEDGANNLAALNSNSFFQPEEEGEYPDYSSDEFDSETDDEGDTICFYSESGDDDITCLPEVESQDDLEKRNYLFRSKKAGYLFRSRRAPSYLFRSRRAPSYLFRSRRSPDFAKKAQGYLFRSRRAPSYLFRSRKAPSYLFRSKKAPSYLFRSKKSDGRQSRSYFFRSRKAPGYLFRSRRSKGYLFRSRREEQTDNSVKNDNDQSIATRAGYLFRTRKSFPSEMTDAQEQPKVELTGSPLTRHLRSKSYLFRS